MITIKNEVKKYQPNFWNNCLFHPTDAVEDPWGRKILDRMAKDKAIDTVRIYAMFEDIVYLDEDDNLAYDFRLSDLRLDYLVEKGYKILIAYGMMPECIATNKKLLSNVSKNKTRYKGKMLNTSVPVSYDLWEEICYEYTKHNIERYGIDTVSKWHVHCGNEPDIPAFFMGDLPEEDYEPRLREYCKMYKAFTDGILRASDKLCMGGPALARQFDFFEGFLNFVRENNIRLDYIAMHNYSEVTPDTLNDGSRVYNVDNWVETHEKVMSIINKCGFSDTELVVDEWGMATHGFYNVEECPAFIARETEVFSAYYAKLIHTIIKKGWKMSKLMICLSGQHEMVTDFLGFRNFFTLNFIAKPIYNAYIMASKLHTGLVDADCENDNIYVVPTKNEDNGYAVLLSYSSDEFKEDLPEICEEVVFDDSLEGKEIFVYCIDKNTTNPYRLYEKGVEDIKALRNEGKLVPVAKYSANEKIELKLTSNSTYLVEVK